MEKLRRSVGKLFFAGKPYRAMVQKIYREMLGVMAKSFLKLNFMVSVPDAELTLTHTRPTGVFSVPPPGPATPEVATE